MLLGGSGFDLANAIAADASGIYVAGNTGSANFPIVPVSGALQPSRSGSDDDAFVAKVKPDGSGLLYSTYLGGAITDRAFGIAADAAGNAYVTGISASDDFPVRNALFPFRSSVPGGFPTFDAYLAKINPTGTALVYSSYFGGTGDEISGHIAVDSAGRATIAGQTSSRDLPTVAAWQSQLQGSAAFVARWNATGSSLDFSTYLGSGSTRPGGLFLESSGATWVTGSTCCSSESFPVLNGYDMTGNGYDDAFLARLIDGPAPVAVVVTSSPVGRTLTVDGRTVTAPFTFSWQPGSTHTLDANTPQVQSSVVYSFASWSNGGTAVQTFTAGNTPQTYTATYSATPCTWTTDPSAKTFGFEGAWNFPVNVTTQTACPWSAQSGASWLYIDSGAGDRTGSGSFSIRLDPNLGPQRSTNVTIGGISFTVTQTGGAAALAAPVINSPFSGQTVQTRGVSFTWTAVSGATAYDIAALGSQSFRTPNALVFRGFQQGAAATSTLIDLPTGAYGFFVRACTETPSDATCGPFATVDVAVNLISPTQFPVILSPASGQTFTSSTQEFRWQPIPGALRYQVTLADNANRIEMQINTPDTSTIYSMKGAPSYTLRVAGCMAACAEGFSSFVTFNTNLAAVPASAPTVSGATALSATSYRINWNAVTGADIYRIAVVQPNTGPGGGALTVASTQTAVPEVTLSVPPGPASVIVAACTGRGCGPYSAPFAVNPPGPAPATPVIGQPISVTNVDGPLVLFTWSRVPGDNGSNTTYRLYSADLSRSATALDIQTKNNFHAALFAAEGRRYDAVVAVNPGPLQTISAPVGFIVQGNSSASPTPAAPTHDGSVKAGNVEVGWAPVPGSAFYQYSVFKAGEPTATATGVTPGVFMLVPLTAQGAGTRYSAIMRACPTGNATVCKPDSDAGWEPWSNAPGGPGVTNFTVVP